MSEKYIEDILSIIIDHVSYDVQTKFPSWYFLNTEQMRLQKIS